MYRQPVLASCCLALAGALTEPLARAAAPMVDTSRLDLWVGNGMLRSCTSGAVVRAVAKGGVIRFRCGPDPVRIEQDGKLRRWSTRAAWLCSTAEVWSRSAAAARRRILYQNTCDRRQTWTRRRVAMTRPRLVSSCSGLTFAANNATGATYDGGGGGAIFARGGRLEDRALYVPRQPLRRDGTGPWRRCRAGAVAASRAAGDRRSQRFRSGVCSNGGALKSIGVSWSI